ncbi:MAG: thioredoxin family protein [Candidatus Shapirobacteria bacterium]
MTLKLFTQPNCSKCPTAHALVHQLTVNSEQLIVEEYNVTTADGLAEASFYSVMATPSLVLLDDSGKEIHTWRAETPSLTEINALLR